MENAILSQQGFVIEIDEAVEFEFYIFKLNEDARESITIQDRIIPFEHITILDWLYWRYFDEDVQLVNEDFILNAEFEEV